VAIVDRHDYVFTGKGSRVALIGDLVNFHTSGEGPRGHETHHHAAVSELVLDGVGVVWACLFKELLEVVHGWPRLMLATAYDHRSVLHVRAACLLLDVAIIVDRDCGLLAVLLVPPIAALCALLSILDGDIRQCSPATTRGRVKLGHLVADGVLGGDASPLLDGVLEGAVVA
jgi:hypothetical protein